MSIQTMKIRSNQDVDFKTVNEELLPKINELIDAVNDLEAVVYEAPDDSMKDLDDDEDDRAWKETDPFVERLHHLSTSQLEHLMEEAEWILEERHRQGQEYVCPECQAREDEERDDGYCEQCNDYHDAPDDDDEGVTEDVQKVVDDVRGKNEPRGSTPHPSSETYFITKEDGLLFDLVKMCVLNPDIRLGQALTNISGYRKVWGEDKDGELKDLWELGKAKKGKKGA